MTWKPKDNFSSPEARCPHCGTPVPRVEYHVCENCGTELEITEETQVIFHVNKIT